MNLPHLLSLPDSGGTYYFRRYIPTDLIEHFGGVKQFRISLKCAIKSRSIRTCTTYHTKILRMLRQDSCINLTTQRILKTHSGRIGLVWIPIRESNPSLTLEGNMENESHMSLLTVLNSGNTYYFRREIPTDLIEYFRIKCDIWKIFY